MLKTQKERLTVLEVQVQGVCETQQVILERQDKILEELAKYRGAFGAATLLFSAIATALFIFKDYILIKLSFKG